MSLLDLSRLRQLSLHNRILLEQLPILTGDCLLVLLVRSSSAFSLLLVPPPGSTLPLLLLLDRFGY